jgi:hypothetical protein
MGEVYCIGNGEVFLDWQSYYNYCIKNQLPIRYTKPAKSLEGGSVLAGRNNSKQQYCC